jgi:hypothetical protein
MNSARSPKMNQLELFVSQAVAVAKETNALETECAKLLFDGKTELIFTWDMTVLDVHCLWDDLHGEKLDQWEARFKPGIKACLEQLAKLGPRDRKGRAPVKAEMAKLQERCPIARALIEGHYQAAQDDLDERVHEQWRQAHPKLDDEAEERAHEDFWHTITEARALEEVGEWTLQDAADVAISWATATTEELADHEPFRTAYLRARKRGGKIRQTSGEYYMGSGLIVRCAMRAGETVYGLNGRPLEMDPAKHALIWR